MSSPGGYEAIKAAERALKADSGDGPELTVEESLQSIAVELHRANLLKGEELRLQERQIDLVRNGLDLLRAPASSEVGGGVAEAMREFTSSLIGPLGVLLGDAAKPRPPRVESLPAPDRPPVESERGGIRVEQKPEE